MADSTKIGTNRTGAEMALDNVKSMIKATEEFPPDVKGGPRELEKQRVELYKNSKAIGSVPMPASIKGNVKTAVNKLLGNNPVLFIDKLAERLAFERAGVRLYEAAIAKATALKDDSVVKELKHICKEEAQHMELLIKTAKKLGADPTAVTPAADVTGVIGLGLMKVVSDPKTNMAQSLDALLSAELTDNAGWELLIELASENGTDDTVESFRKALNEEQKHLDKIKAMLKQALV